MIVYNLSQVCVCACATTASTVPLLSPSLFTYTYNSFHFIFQGKTVFLRPFLSTAHPYGVFARAQSLSIWVNLQNCRNYKRVFILIKYRICYAQPHGNILYTNRLMLWMRQASYVTCDWLSSVSLRSRIFRWFSNDVTDFVGVELQKDKNSLCMSWRNGFISDCWIRILITLNWNEVGENSPWEDMNSDWKHEHLKNEYIWSDK